MKSIFISVAILAAAIPAYADDTKPFDGGYIGGEVGYLHDEAIPGTYLGGFIGWRKQDNNSFVFGLEGSLGMTVTGNIYDESDAEDFFKSQWTVLGTAGYASGRNLFQFGAGYARANSSYVYGGEKIDVSFGAVAGMVGYERAIGSNLSLRARVVTYELDQFIPSIGLALRF